MHIRTFRAASLQEALAQIRDQMGPDASVLHTRQVRDGWRGWLGRTLVEVTAGSKDYGVGDGNKIAAGSNPNATGPQSPTGVDASNGHPSRGSFTPINRIESAYLSTGDLASRDLLRSTHSLLGSTHSTPQPASPFNPIAPSDPAADSPLATIRESLIAQGVTPQTADRWLDATRAFAAATSLASGLLDDETAHTTDHWIDHLRRSVARELRIGSPIRTQPGDRRVVALVGPTGVGKTTTVAKLAAGFRIEAKRRVGLLTIDTFRIAAVQQLRAYADIMDLPMEVVERRDQMTEALDRLGDVDLVLIDTAGRSPRSDARVEQLVDMLAAAKPDETHLVISSTAGADCISATLQGFAPVAPSAVILTKIDETPHLAGPLSALASGSAMHGGMPLSYLTNGQSVPDDISVAHAEPLVERLIPADVCTGEYRGDDYLNNDYAGTLQPTAIGPAVHDMQDRRVQDSDRRVDAA